MVPGVVVTVTPPLDTLMLGGCPLGKRCIGTAIAVTLRFWLPTGGGPGGIEGTGVRFICWLELRRVTLR
jgi:hypothetical protein